LDALMVAPHDKAGSIASVLAASIAGCKLTEVWRKCCPTHASADVAYLLPLVRQVPRSRKSHQHRLALLSVRSQPFSS
jgi:hypothetical protein